MTNREEAHRMTSHDLEMKLREVCREIQNRGYGVTELEVYGIAAATLKNMVREEVTIQREHDLSWEVIGGQLGVSRQAAWEQYR